MAVFGWLILLIGGVPNSAQSKFVTRGIGALLVYAWMNIFQCAPFSIVLQ